MTTQQTDIPPVIHVAAALILDERGNFLLVRKRGSSAFMQAGGKLEPGESSRDALLRELHEEIGLLIEANALQFLGQYAAPAANEHGHVVIADVFLLDIGTIAISPAAEIEEIAWIDPNLPTNLLLAPLTRDYILPLARDRSTGPHLPEHN